MLKINKTSKNIIVLNAILMSAIFLGNYFYLTEGGFKLKALCSGGFALMGIINLCYALKIRNHYDRFCISMTIGLFFAMMGDIVLGSDFVIGASLFAIGHICYFVAYCFLEKINVADIIVGGVIFILAGSFILFCPLLEFSAQFMQVVCLVYALIISFMLGKAITNFFRDKNATSAVLFAGSILFFFSDLMLVFDWFMGMGRIAGRLCMATYYPAECILAIAIFVSCFKFRKKAVSA